MSYPDYKLRLSARARNDFKSILRYTGEKWGRGQIFVYGELLNKALDTIRLNPDIGHEHENLPPSLKTYLVGSHVIVYRVAGVTVSVARILHQRMSLARNLP